MIDADAQANLTQWFTKPEEEFEIDVRAMTRAADEAAVIHPPKKLRLEISEKIGTSLNILNLFFIKNNIYIYYIECYLTNKFMILRNKN